jgi:hypothetical protein
MAFPYGGDQLTLADGFYVLPLFADAFPVLILGWLAIIQGQISDLILVALESSKFLVVTIEEATR